MFEHSPIVLRIICKKCQFTKDITKYIIKKDCVFFDKDAIC